MKKSIVEILKDDERLTEYIQPLEEDINKTEDADATLDLILNNILHNCDNFSDRRALKSTLIESATDLIKLKTELPMKKKLKILLPLNKKKIIHDRPNNYDGNRSRSKGYSCYC